MHYHRMPKHEELSLLNQLQASFHLKMLWRQISVLDVNHHVLIVVCEIPGIETLLWLNIHLVRYSIHQSCKIS